MQTAAVTFAKLRRYANHTVAIMGGAHAEARAFADPGAEESLAAARAHDGAGARQLVMDALDVEKITPRDAAAAREEEGHIGAQLRCDPVEGPRIVRDVPEPR